VEGTPGAEGLGGLAQGSLEMSNVQIVEEMVNMITAQRAYEVNSKSIQTADDMLQTANNLRR
jgi:flagellar basal-body rod protein FlgG